MTCYAKLLGQIVMQQLAIPRLCQHALVTLYLFNSPLSVVLQRSGFTVEELLLELVKKTCSEDKIYRAYKERYVI